MSDLIQTPIITTAQDLEDFILSIPSVYRNLSPSVIDNLSSDVKTIIQVYDYALSKGFISYQEIKSMMDFDNATEEVLHAYAEMYRIPLPRFPNQSKVRAHVHKTIIKTDLGGGTNWSYEAQHTLGTEDYMYQVMIDDAGTDVLVNPEDVFQLIRIEANSIYLESTTSLTINKILFIYTKTYLPAKRLLCKNADLLEASRYTKLGLESYLNILLQNNSDVDFDIPIRTWGILRLFTFVGNVNNSSDSKTMQFDPALPGTTDYDDRDLSSTNPRLYTGQQNNLEKTLTINADLQPDIKAFIEEVVFNYFLPFKTQFAQSLNYVFTDYSIDWPEDGIIPQEGVGYWYIQVDFVVS